MPASDTASNMSNTSGKKSKDNKAKKGKAKSKSKSTENSLTEPLNPKEQQKNMDLQKAAWQLEDALQGRGAETYPDDQKAFDMHSRSAKAEHDCMIAYFVLVLLSIFETPTWCDNRRHFFRWIDPSERCVVYTNVSSFERVPPDDVLLANIPYIPPGFALIIEAYLLLKIGHKLLLESNVIKLFMKVMEEEIKEKESEPKKRLQDKESDGAEEEEKKKFRHNLMVANFGLVMVVCALIDVGCYAAFRGPIRMGFVFRSCLFALLPAVQNLGACVLQVLAELISTACFLFGTIIFFSWIAVTIFIDKSDHVFIMAETGTKVNEGMDSFSSTLYTMFVAGATDEFVDVLQPTYSTYRASGLLWMVFLVMVRILLLNLVLDTLVAAYTKSTKKFEKTEANEKVEGIRRAFATLVGAEEKKPAAHEHIHTHEEEELKLSKDRFLTFIKEFGNSPGVRSIKQSTAGILFDCMASDENSKVNNFYYKFVKNFNEKLSNDAVCEPLQQITDYLETWLNQTMNLPGEERERFGAQLDIYKQILSIYKSGPDPLPESARQDVQRKISEHDALGPMPDEDMPASHITEAQFCETCAVLDYDFWTTVHDSPVRFELPKIWKSWLFRRMRQWNSKAKENPKEPKVDFFTRIAKMLWNVVARFDQFMTMVLVFNLVLVILESYYDLHNIDEPAYLAQFELIFGFLYVMEVGVKLCCVSWGEYCSDRSNVFDFFTTWLLLSTSLLEDEMAGGSNLKRYANILRLFRLLRVGKQLRLLKRMRQVQFMISTITQLVIASKQILTLLFVVVYFFTTLSVQLWGGLLYRENPLLEGQEYEEEKYHVLNFNDFPMAFGTWVVILLCEYIPLFSEAIRSVSPTRQTWWVFLIFYFTAVCIVFELVKAFTIEVFMDLKKEWDKVDPIGRNFTEAEVRATKERPEGERDDQERDANDEEDLEWVVKEWVEKEKKDKEKENVRDLRVVANNGDLLCEGEEFEFLRDFSPADDYPVQVSAILVGGDEEDNFKGLDAIRSKHAAKGMRIHFRAGGDKMAQEKFREALEKKLEKKEHEEPEK